MPSPPAACMPVACQLLALQLGRQRAAYRRYTDSTGNLLPSSSCPYSYTGRRGCPARSGRAHCRDTPTCPDSKRRRRQTRRASRLLPRRRSGSLPSSIAILESRPVVERMELTACLRAGNLHESQCDARNARPFVDSARHIADTMEFMRVDGV
jgi:hypothetical protein